MSQWKLQRVERSLQGGGGGRRSPCCQCWLLSCYLLPAKEAGRETTPAPPDCEMRDNCRGQVSMRGHSWSISRVITKTSQSQNKQSPAGPWHPDPQSGKFVCLRGWPSINGRQNTETFPLPANCWLFCCGIVSVSQPLSLSLQLILSRSLNYWQDIDGIFIQQIQFTCKIA